jgi:hypothetical protein
VARGLLNREPAQASRSSVSSTSDHGDSHPPFTAARALRRYGPNSTSIRSGVA